MNAIFVSLYIFITATSLTCGENILSRVLVFGGLIIALIFFVKSKAKNIFTPLFLCVLAYVIACGISTFYAYSGKFAINEFMKILLGFNTFLFVTINKDSKFVLWCISTLTAFVSFLTIESATIGLLGPKLQQIFYGGELAKHAIFDGDRFTSFFGNANVLATILGIVLFLTVYLYKVEKDSWNKALLAIYLINMAYTFLMVFSMGGTFALMLSCFGFLIFSQKEERISNILIIAQTGIFALIILVLTVGSYVAYSTSNSILPIALIIIFGILMAYLDIKKLDKVKQIINEKSKQIKYGLGAFIGLVLVFVVLAMNITTSITLSPNQKIERVVYLDAGDYHIWYKGENLDGLEISVLTRDTAGIYNDEDTILTSGSVRDISQIQIDENVQQVKIVINNPTNTNIKLANLQIITQKGEVLELKLNYLFLPSNIEHRIQGIATNSSSKTRIQYVRDSIKLFVINPIKGYGLGGFANAVQSVQIYHYETKYAHNHFAQMLVDTGMVGFFVYLLLVVYVGFVLIKQRKHELSAVFFGAFCMFVIHTSNELSMSSTEFMPLIFALFALISVNLDTEVIDKKYSKLIVILPMTMFLVVASGNIYANFKRTYATPLSASDLVFLSKIDIYEKNDFMLSYVMSYKTAEDAEMRTIIDEYLYKLENSNSNSINAILTQYFIETNNPARAYKNIEIYTNYSKYDDATWENALQTYADTLIKFNANFQNNKEIYQTQINDLLNELEKINAKSVTKIEISEETMDKIEQLIRG